MSTVCIGVLIIWVVLAGISVVADVVFMFRCLTGREGGQALVRTCVTAERVGGLGRWIMISLALDICTPWLMWQGLLSPSHNEDI